MWWSSGSVAGGYLLLVLQAVPPWFSIQLTLRVYEEGRCRDCTEQAAGDLLGVLLVAICCWIYLRFLCSAVFSWLWECIKEVGGEVGVGGVASGYLLLVLQAVPPWFSIQLTLRVYEEGRCRDCTKQAGGDLLGVLLVAICCWIYLRFLCSAVFRWPWECFKGAGVEVGICWGCCWWLSVAGFTCSSSVVQYSNDFESV